MKQWLFIGAASVFALGACATANVGDLPPVEVPIPPPPAPPPAEETAEAPAAPMQIGEYSDIWTLEPFWPGEWPDGFTVTADDVVLKGRQDPVPWAPMVVTCPLAKNTNVSPWNHARIESDGWEFMSAQYRSKITMKEDVTLLTGFSEKPKQLVLKAGDVMRYEAYYSEGFFRASFDGENYELNEVDLNGIAEIEPGEPSDLWVNVACDFTKGERAWLLLSDIEGLPGIGMASYDEFGVASDLDKGPNTVTR